MSGMTFIDIEPGQWVLAFQQPYGPYHLAMPDHLEMFAERGGGWDHHHASEIFVVHLVEAIAPKTYQAAASDPSYRQLGHPVGRHHRSHVIAAVASQTEAIALRDKFFGIGVDTSNATEEHMRRRIEKFAQKKSTSALRKIHRLLPEHFGCRP
ncbi:hypothetical protein G6M50_38225 [Agrobacterium rhizogenes]|nr:hypothetical protein [Rhizobium rhizogenes]NTJ83625.1 hypothetical protein [Rhizobium rhizogenes]